MNIYAIRVIYRYEMLRAWETLLQSFVSPVISTALYFVVFGSAIGSRSATNGRITNVANGGYVNPSGKIGSLKS